MGQGVLFVTQTEHLNVEPLRVPTHADVFVAISGEDILLVGC